MSDLVIKERKTDDPEPAPEVVQAEAVQPVRGEYRVALIFECPVCGSSGTFPDGKSVSAALMSGGALRLGVKCKACDKPIMLSMHQDVITVPVGVPMNRAARRANGL